jgi:SAM-dependent methyltransferase/HAMP domain-containing protein
MTPHSPAGSFRDPAGSIVLVNGVVYRRIEPPGRDAYEQLTRSGLFDTLVREGLLIAHEDLGPSDDHPGAFTVIRPEPVPVISYPYEWCFGQLRDAALATLRVQRRALDFGMSLKDASAYNVQFHRGRPILIDTLSFESYRPRPWVAYRQFCQHFYAPLLLAARVDPSFLRLLALHIDGVPLDVASRLLPRRTLLRAGPLLHIHLHAAAARRWAATPDAPGKKEERGSKEKALRLVDSLERAIGALAWKPRSNWTSYYDDRASYDSDAFALKERTVTQWLERLRATRVVDLGANTGRYSRIAERLGALVVASDADPACVEAMYAEVRRENLARLLPLFYDLANPSPRIGWANEERLQLEERTNADLVLALALVHHVAIGNNVPLPAFAAYLARLAPRAIVEFVPKSDPMVRAMLSARDDVFNAYTVESFERALAERFSITDRVELGTGGRVLYLMVAP